MPKITVYAGLLRTDGTEPPRASGYHRIYLGEMSALELLHHTITGPVAFPDVTAPGYGVVTDIALFCGPEDSDSLWLYPQGPRDIHPGVVPFIKDNKLMLGVDVSASINASLRSACAV